MGPALDVRVERRNLDAGFLMWSMHRRIALERLPDRRVVACFSFSGTPRAYRGPRVFWLLLQRVGAEVCITDPGLEVDLQVDADLATMTSVWLGDLPLGSALARRRFASSGRGRSRPPSRRGSC
jgi:hypothetical protein